MGSRAGIIRRDRRIVARYRLLDVTFVQLPVQLVPKQL